jgi:hypothetical protein
LFICFCYCFCFFIVKIRAFQEEKQKKITGGKIQLGKSAKLSKLDNFAQPERNNDGGEIIIAADLNIMKLAGCGAENGIKRQIVGKKPETS